MTKTELLSQLLAPHGSHAFVHFDPRVVGSLVPTQLRGKPSVVFQVGHHLHWPIKFLHWDQYGLSGIFRFQGQEESCYIPMDAIYAIVDSNGSGALYSNNLPKEVEAKLVEKSRVARLPSTDFKRPDGVLDLEAYRLHKKAKPWQPPSES